MDKSIQHIILHLKKQCSLSGLTWFFVYVVKYTIIVAKNKILVTKTTIISSMYG